MKKNEKNENIIEHQQQAESSKPHLNACLHSTGRDHHDGDINASIIRHVQKLGARDAVFFFTELSRPMTLTTFLLCDDLSNLFLSSWLDVRSLVTLDVAFSNKTSTTAWRFLLRSVRSTAIDGWVHSLASLMWLIRRGIRVSRIQIKVVACQIRRCDLLLLETSDLVHFGLNSCDSFTEQFMLNFLHQCGKSWRTERPNRTNVTNAGVSALGAQLESIDLGGCTILTDTILAGLSLGCCQLQSINLRFCDNLTDIGMSALGHRCPRLQSINLWFCCNVTESVY
jgi:hypothetical protein